MPRTVPTMIITVMNERPTLQMKKRGWWLTLDGNQVYHPTSGRPSARTEQWATLFPRSIDQILLHTYSISTLFDFYIWQKASRAQDGSHLFQATAWKVSHPSLGICAYTVNLLYILCTRSLGHSVIQSHIFCIHTPNKGRNTEAHGVHFQVTMTTKSKHWSPF